MKDKKVNFIKENKVTNLEGINYRVFKVKNNSVSYRCEIQTDLIKKITRTPYKAEIYVVKSRDNNDSKLLV